MASAISTFIGGGTCLLHQEFATRTRQSLEDEKRVFAFPLIGRSIEVSEVSRRGHSHVCRAQAKAAKAKGGKGGSSQALPKKSHKIEKLEVNKVAKVEAFQVFARLEKDKDDLGRFKPIAEILVAEGSDVAKAIKERRRQLVELAKERVEFVNSSATDINYAFQKSPKKDERHDLNPTIISVGGPIDYESIPAILKSAEASGLRVYQPKERSLAPSITE